MRAGGGSEGAPGGRVREGEVGEARSGGEPAGSGGEPAGSGGESGRRVGESRRRVRDIWEASPGGEFAGKFAGHLEEGQPVVCPALCVDFVPVPGCDFWVDVGLARRSLHPLEFGPNSLLPCGLVGPLERERVAEFVAVFCFGNELPRHLQAHHNSVAVAFLQELLTLPPPFSETMKLSDDEEEDDRNLRIGHACLCEVSGPETTEDGGQAFRLKGVSGLCDVQLMWPISLPSISAFESESYTCAVHIFGRVLGEPGGIRPPRAGLAGELHHDAREWSRYDTGRLAAELYSKLEDALTSSRVHVPRRLYQRPGDLSYWVLRHIPFNCSDDIQWAFDAPHVMERLRRCIDLVEGCYLNEFSALYCSGCDTKICGKDCLIHIPGSEKGEITGHYINPHGTSHRIIAISDDVSSCVDVEGIDGRPTEQHSWFPGYGWEVATCDVCRELLGWKFTGVRGAVPRSFFALRRDAFCLYPDGAWQRDMWSGAMAGLDAGQW